MVYKLPPELKYTSTHEWVKIEDVIAISGISDFAQHQLGDIVYVELPEIGKVFEKGTVIAEIESVKAVSEFYAALSGEIIELNEKIRDNPELINNSPYEEGWFVKVKISNPDEINSFLTIREYQEIIQKEEKK